MSDPSVPTSRLARNIPEHVERVVAARGDAPAICAEGSMLTYAEWNRQANRLARAILAKNPDRDEPIGLVFGFGVAGIVAMLAALKTGKPYAVFDPAFDSRRLAETAVHFGPGLLVSHAACSGTAAELAAATGAAVLDLEHVDAKLPDDNLELALDAARVAYVYYTSGSTGRPKGVTATHTIRLVNYREFAERLRLTPDDRFTNLHSLGFSAASTEIWGALMTGATLFPVDVRQVGFAGLAERLRRNEITLWSWSASAFRRFAAGLPEGTAFPNMRAVLLGSEPVTLREAELFRGSAFPDACVLVNRYGATEIGNTHYFLFDKRMPDPVGTMPVGFPVGPRRIWLEDEAGQTVPDGSSGEIVIESSIVTPGYWREPALTDARLQPGSAPGTRIYRTGDLGRLLPNGALQHLGRKDNQVKIRGYRIELVEVESALLRVPGVADAAVITDRRADEGVCLVAYIVPAEGATLTARELRQQLSVVLPDYMLPSLYQLLPSLPLTDTGKVARALLPLPQWPDQRPEMDEEPLAPLEQAVLALFRQALSAPGARSQDDFFELGGDSLQAAQLVNRLSAAVGEPMLPTLLFDASSVLKMAELLRSRYPQAAERLAQQGLRRSN